MIFFHFLLFTFSLHFFMSSFLWLDNRTFLSMKSNVFSIIFFFFCLKSGLYVLWLMCYLCVRGGTKSIIHFIESFIKLPSKEAMTRSVLNYDDRQENSAVHQVVCSKNKIFYSKDNKAIIGAIKNRALHSLSYCYDRKKREESQSGKTRTSQFCIYPFRLCHLPFIGQ